jgi:hypothetical protein
VIKRETSLRLFFWTASSLAIIAYLLSSYKSGYILRLYREDASTYAVFSLISILALGFCLGKLSETITDALGLEIEKIEHFEG